MSEARSGLQGGGHRGNRSAGAGRQAASTAPGPGSGPQPQVTVARRQHRSRSAARCPLRGAGRRHFGAGPGSDAASAARSRRGSSGELRLKERARTGALREAETGSQSPSQSFGFVAGEAAPELHRLKSSPVGVRELPRSVPGSPGERSWGNRTACLPSAYL